MSTQHHPTETTLGAWMILRNFFLHFGIHENAFTITSSPTPRSVLLPHPQPPCTLRTVCFIPAPGYSAPPPPIGKRSIVMCVSVCVFVCPRSYVRNYTSDLHQIFVHVTGGFKGGGKGGMPPRCLQLRKVVSQTP